MAAYTPVLTVATAAQTLVAVPFDYLSPTHVHVVVNGVEKTRPTEWDFNSGYVQFVTPLTAGDVVFIHRVTPIDARMVTYQDASTLSQVTLNLDSNQWWYTIQELGNQTFTFNGLYWDASNGRIGNVAPAVNNNDVVTYGQLQAYYTGTPGAGVPYWNTGGQVGIGTSSVYGASMLTLQTANGAAGIPLAAMRNTSTLGTAVVRMEWINSGIALGTKTLTMEWNTTGQYTLNTDAGGGSSGYLWRVSGTKVLSVLAGQAVIFGVDSPIYGNAVTLTGGGSGVGNDGLIVLNNNWSGNAQNANGAYVQMNTGWATFGGGTGTSGVRLRASGSGNTLDVDSTGRVLLAGQSAASGYTTQGDITLPPLRNIRAKNTVKAWCTFNGTVGSPTVNDGFNVNASITKNGTGDYTITFTNAIANANHAVVINARRVATDSALLANLVISSVSNPTTTSIRIQTRTVSATLEDSDRVTVVVFGE